MVLSLKSEGAVPTLTMNTRNSLRKLRETTTTQISNVNHHHISALVDSIFHEDLHIPTHKALLLDTTRSRSSGNAGLATIAVLTALEPGDPCAFGARRARVAFLELL
jgi:hypothetical protein